jgi:hypothetical protein
LTLQRRAGARPLPAGPGSYTQGRRGRWTSRTNFSKTTLVILFPNAN